MSYAFEISGGVPVHLYWGPAIDRIDDLPSADDHRQRRHAQPDRICNDYQEYPAFFGEFPNPLIGVIRSLGTPEIQRFQRRFDSLPVHKRKSLRIFPLITGHIFRADYNGTLF